MSLNEKKKKQKAKNKKELQERPNKSLAKRELNDLKDQAAVLLKISSEKIKQLDLQPALLDALIEMQSIKHPNAQKRHLQYITKLLLDQENLEAIKEKLSFFSQPHLLHKRLDNEVSIIVTQLMQDDEDALTRILEHPNLVDKQNFLQLLRNSKKEIHSAEPQEDPIQKNEGLAVPSKDSRNFKRLKTLIKQLINET